jgi:NTP pyrophosphatase (non-canonical NTP hydrolase)
MSTSNKPIPEDTEIRQNYAEDINRLSDLCYGLSAKAGWWTNLSTGEPLERNKGEMIALIHSEISEALEGVRKDIPDDKLTHRKAEEVELADALIRIFDYAGGFGLDVGGAFVEKLLFNQNRADHKIENRMKEGGKKI